MPGPPPNENRRRRNAPARGDWTTLPAQNHAKPPRMPPSPRGGWAAQTKRAWKAWWADPASLVWTPSDFELVAQLAELHHELARLEGSTGRASLSQELRLRMDALGLTQKGKRDLRLKVQRIEVVAEEVEASPATAPGGRYGHLRAAGGRG